MEGTKYGIRGRIVERDSGAGIPDLIVVVYDVDPLVVDPRTQIAALRQAKDEVQFWSLVPGQRIGSVASGRSGEFVLGFDECRYKSRDGGTGPDLLLVVLAPEELRECDDGFAALPVHRRVLYCSPTPITNAGLQEVTVIRLPRALLESFGLVRAARRPRTGTETVAAIAQTKNLALAIEASNQTQAIARLAPVMQLRGRIDAALSKFSLSAFAAEHRATTTYVGKKEALAPKQQLAVSRQLERIPQVLDKNVQRNVRMQVPASELAALGLTVDGSSGRAEGQIELAQIVQRVQRSVAAGPLERNRSWVEIECAALDAERTFDDAARRCAEGHAHGHGNGTSNGTTTTTVAALTGEVDVVLREHLGRQLAHVVAPEIELQYGVENGGQVTATITRPGPADVTSYHDFHDLQIAFEQIWTEALDDDLYASFRHMYEEMVRYKHRISGVETTPAVETIDDMKELYEEFRTLEETIASATEAESEPPPAAPTTVPPAVKSMVPDITSETWSKASPSEQAQLVELAEELANLNDYGADDFFGDFFTGGATAAAREIRKDDIRKQARAIVASLRTRPAPTPPSSRGRRHRTPRTSSRLARLFDELDERLAEPHKFDIFAPDSVNFGIMLTYRQKWVPLDYQVGSLVSTMPLAPKEVRKYTTKRVVKKTRSEKELEEREQSTRRESSSTSRADSEIVRQARDKTSFEQTASGTVDVGVFQGTFGTRFGAEAENSSSRTKKNFREAVLKSVDEFKQKHSVEVQVSTSDELQTEFTGEISNPNDEIAVTYLFYELQRQYEISERLHRLTPVVLVANDVPSPHEIDEDWLIAHHWILDRAMLDDSLRPALAHVTTGLAGDELALESLRDNVERQADLVHELTLQTRVKTELAEQAFQEIKNLVRMARSVDDASKLKDIGMALMFGPFALAGSGGDDEAAEKREEIAKMALERADKDVQEVNARLTREVTALQTAIDKYVGALREHFDRQSAIARLRIHVKQNILYYMQTIWDHEPSDQRYFRLYNIDVPWIETGTAAAATAPAMARVVTRSSGGTAPMYEVVTRIPFEIPDLQWYFQNTKKLGEVADLDNLLGYKGNYMIFPARMTNHLHVYMMQDYVDAGTGGLRDPSEVAGGVTSRELLDYVCCLQRNRPQEFERRRQELLELVRERLASPTSESEMVIVPTDSLFIEALPGAHPVMEAFKRVHRSLDVKKVQSEVRQAELENLRLVARLLEGQRGDPEIEKLVRVTGVDTVDVEG